jgi:hypothetical protein
VADLHRSWYRPGSASSHMGHVPGWPGPSSTGTFRTLKEGQRRCAASCGRNPSSRPLPFRLWDLETASYCGAVGSTRRALARQSAVTVVITSDCDDVHAGKSGCIGAGREGRMRSRRMPGLAV